MTRNDHGATFPFVWSCEGDVLHNHLNKMIQFLCTAASLGRIKQWARDDYQYFNHRDQSYMKPFSVWYVCYRSKPFLNHHIRCMA